MKKTYERTKYTVNFVKERIDYQNNTAEKITFIPIYDCKILMAVKRYKADKVESKIIKMLKNNGIDINKVIEGKCHPLIEALKSDKISFLEELIENGVCVEFTDSIGYSPLYYAIAYSKPETFALLLKQKGIDVNEIELLVSPITTALYKGDLPLCELLISAGAEINNVTYIYFYNKPFFNTPFNDALSLNRIDICIRFLELNVELDLNMKFSFSRIMNESDELAIHIVSNDLIDKEKLEKKDLYYYNKLEKKVDKLLTTKTLKLAAEVLEFAEALDDAREVELLAKEDILAFLEYTPETDL